MNYITKRFHDHPVLVAIDGFGGSGKTTLAKRLAAALNKAYVIHLDDFILKANILNDSWDKTVFDRQRLKSQVLEPCSEGRVIKYQKLLWDTNELSKPITVVDTDFLIIEGITALHPDINTFYSYKIWSI